MIQTILKYFTSAKRIALLAQENHTKKWYHLYSVIELIPAESSDYNIPTKEWHDGKIIRSEDTSDKSAYSFYLMVQDIESTGDAIKLFEDPIRNTIEETPIYYFNTQFVKEPSSEYPFILPQNREGSQGVASVLPKRHSGLLLWTQIDHERKVENWFRRDTTSAEMKAISKLTNRWLGFDMWANSEHFGNVYLVASNPYFRRFIISLSENPIGIFYHFEMRKGIKEYFKIRVIDRHGNNLVLDRVYEAKQNIGLIELPHEPQVIELVIYDSNNNVVAVHDPSTFIKSIHVQMKIKHADFHAMVRNKEGDEKVVKAEKYAPLQEVVIGDSKGFNAGNYFKNAERLKKRENNDFIFYRGGKSPEEISNLKANAKEEIKKIINGTKETCFLCDPYFNVNDLIEYVYTIQDSSVAIKIVNAKEFINVSSAKLLLDAINEYNKTPFHKIDCRMLRGRSILHDRFILSDLNVWFLGSSFSEFGNRATCLGKVPESECIEIVKEIERWYNDTVYTQSLEDYVNNKE